jgi:hypothetical protein
MLLGAAPPAAAAPVRADAPNPTAVTIAGSLQSELGCSGDWQPDCAAPQLTYDASDDVWQGAFTLPAGSYEYKAPLNNSWTENYGANARRDGPNIGLSLTAQTGIKFYYDHKSHWVTDNRNAVIATVQIRPKSPCLRAAGDMAISVACGMANILPPSDNGV